MVADGFYAQNARGECRCEFPGCTWSARADVLDGLELATVFFDMHFAMAHAADLAIAVRLRDLVTV